MKKLALWRTQSQRSWKSSIYQPTHRTDFDQGSDPRQNYHPKPESRHVKPHDCKPKTLSWIQYPHFPPVLSQSVRYPLASRHFCLQRGRKDTPPRCRFAQTQTQTLQQHPQAELASGQVARQPQSARNAENNDGATYENGTPNAPTQSERPL